MNLQTNYPAKFILMIASMGILSACSGPEDQPEKKNDIKTPVTLTHIFSEPMAESISFNAMSSFIRKNVIKASATGIVENIAINPGDIIIKGDLLFALKTKEAAAYEKNTTSDSSINFKGEIKIRASKSGVISSIAHQKGDYVQEGEELTTLSEQNSLMFILQVPFEMRDLVKIHGSCKITLNDNLTIPGTIDRKLPVMDLQSQTENYLVKPETSEPLPENLIAKIIIMKHKVKITSVLPKQAILADETLTSFWVMKLINDSVAVKIPIKKGIEVDGKVEILEPAFSSSDKILLTGNYGLADTAKVSINKN